MPLADLNVEYHGVLDIHRPVSGCDNAADPRGLTQHFHHLSSIKNYLQVYSAASEADPYRCSGSHTNDAPR